VERNFSRNYSFFFLPIVYYLNVLPYDKIS